MIVRNLCDRLGLGPDSAQLKIVATSASLDDDQGAYLEGFFGVDASLVRHDPWHAEDRWTASCRSTRRPSSGA